MINNLLKEVKWRNHWLGLCVFILGLILLVYAAWQRHTAKLKLEQAPIDYRAQQDINATAEDQSRILAEYLNIYWQLRDRGVVGEAQRLALLETLQRIATYYELPEVQFILGISQPVTMETNPYWDAEIPMRVTSLSLELKLLHEGQMYFLLEALKKEAPGIFSINKCNMLHDKQTVAAENAVEKAGFTASCELSWFAIVDGISHWSVQPPINLQTAGETLAGPYVEGRLFTTQEERQKINRSYGQKNLSATIEAPKKTTTTAASAPIISIAKFLSDKTSPTKTNAKKVRFSGYVQGPDGQYRVWVNGRSDPSQQHSFNNGNGQLELNNSTATLKPGQVLLSEGKTANVKESYQLPSTRKIVETQTDQNEQQQIYSTSAESSSSLNDVSETETVSENTTSSQAAQKRRPFSK